MDTQMQETMTKEKGWGVRGVLGWVPFALAIAAWIFLRESWSDTWISPLWERVAGDVGWLLGIEKEKVLGEREKMRGASVLVVLVWAFVRVAPVWLLRVGAGVCLVFAGYAVRLVWLAEDFNREGIFAWALLGMWLCLAVGMWITPKGPWTRR